MAIQIDRELSTDSWTARVDALQAALQIANIPTTACEGCRITIAEVATDGLLHVTITKPRETMMATGWAVPTYRPGGSFAYERTFALETTEEMVRHIRDMFTAP